MTKSSGVKSVFSAIVGALIVTAIVVGVGLYVRDVPTPQPLAATPAPAPRSGDMPPNHPPTDQMQALAGDLQAKLQGESDPLILELKNQLAADPNDVEALLSIGLLYVKQREYAKARGYYLRASQVAPKNLEARTHLGTVAYFLGNVDEALHHYEQVLALDPDYTVALFEMGAVLRYGRKDLQGAVDTWEHFLRLDPDAEEAGRIRELVAETKELIAEGAGALEKGEPAEAAPWPDEVTS